VSAPPPASAPAAACASGSGAGAAPAAAVVVEAAAGASGAGGLASPADLSEASLADVAAAEASLETFPASSFTPAVILVASAAHVALACACLRARARLGADGGGGSGARAALAVDLEGVALSRAGEVCVVQIAAARRGAPVYLFDVVALGAAAFDGPRSLRGLLEDGALDKLFFDVRSDANALFFLHGVEVRGVLDLQLADVAARLARGVACDRVAGLAHIVERTPAAGLRGDERAELVRVKAAAHALFVPERGGSYEVWRARPLPPLLRAYCTDAALFFALRASYDAALAPLGARARDALDAAAARRLALAHSDAFDKSDRAGLTAVDAQLAADIAAAVAAAPRAGGGRGGRGGGGGGGARGRAGGGGAGGRGEWVGPTA
jgi:exonuclease 3'-5' domain-containing protein 1